MKTKNKKPLTTRERKLEIWQNLTNGFTFDQYFLVGPPMEKSFLNPWVTPELFKSELTELLNSHKIIKSRVS